ncbi:MAG: adenosine kinase [Pseudomonadales bacterium]|nr:adenosine kinase [Pseudomonadales bacterium]
MSKYNVYGIGNALVDMEFAVDEEFLKKNGIEKGLMTLIDENQHQELFLKLEAFHGKKACGGSAANTIIAVTQFGGNSYYSCKVADDETGSFFLGDLKKCGVSTNLGDERETGVTGKCLVMVTPDADRTMNTFLGITEEVSPSELDENAIINSEYVYLEGYLVTSPSGRAAAVKAREIAEKAGVKTALTFSDPNMVEFFKEGLMEMLGDRVNLLFCNEDEAMKWTGSSDLNKAVESIQGVADTFAITLGDKGALVFDGEKLHNIAPTAATAVDSNGAGDMFAGAFLYAITHGYTYPEAGKLASIAAAKVVSQFGPRLAKEGHEESLAEFGSTQ